MTTLQLALLFFIIANPIGNSPVIIALVKDYDFNRQRWIIMREGFIALVIALFFQFFGEAFLRLIHVQDYALTLCGGILLFMVSLSMIFSLSSSDNKIQLRQEPFIVPIATPILTGPGLMAMIMLKSVEEANNLKILASILLAWLGVFVILALAPYLQRLLGKRGLMALEQLMGMILSLIAINMCIMGAELFLKTLESVHK